jgi:hypothetical protein
MEPNPHRNPADDRYNRELSSQAHHDPSDMGSERIEAGSPAWPEFRRTDVYA